MSRRCRSFGGPTLPVGLEGVVPQAREPPVCVETNVPGSDPGASFFTVGKVTVRRHRESSAMPQSSVARSQKKPFSSPDSGPDAHEPPIAFGLCAYAGMPETGDSTICGELDLAALTRAARTNHAGSAPLRGTPS